MSIHVSPDQPRRRGARALVRLVLIALLTGLQTGCLFGDDPPTLVIYVDRLLQKPLAEAIERYRETREDELPYAIRVVPGDGAELRARIAATPTASPEPDDDSNDTENAAENDAAAPPRADLFLPVWSADANRLGARVLRRHVVGGLVPTVVVHDKWNKGIKTFADLVAPDVRVAIGDKSKLALGRAAEAMIVKTANPGRFREHVIYRTDNDDDLIQLLRAGWADAAIVWSHMAKPLDTAKFQEIALPDGLIDPKAITVIELRDANLPDEAAALADYLAGEAGRAVFARHGFGRPVPPPAAPEGIVAGESDPGDTPPTES